MTSDPYPKSAQLGRPKSSEPRTFRVRASRATWVELRAAKLEGQRCRVCNGWGNPGRSLHHLIPRSLGGDDVAANLVALCGSGTTGCHGLVEARDVLALAMLASRLRDEEYAHVVGQLGESALERLFGVNR